MKTLMLGAMVSVALALVGCGNVRAGAVRTGKLYPSKSAGCEVRFENLSFQEANQKYEQVGLVTLSGASSQPQTWEGETRERLWPKVCELGGTIITPNAAVGGESIAGMGTGMIQFAVWVERPSP